MFEVILFAVVRIRSSLFFDVLKKTGPLVSNRPSEFDELRAGTIDPRFGQPGCRQIQNYCCLFRQEEGLKRFWTARCLAADHHRLRVRLSGWHVVC